MDNAVYTVGHSTHSIERLVSLLQRHRINAIADVRSSPYSRLNPQFNREQLRQELRSRGIVYVFLGEELGARTKDRNCYVGGKVQYDLLAATESYRRGLQRVRKGAKSHCLALFCAEKEPTFCHRMVLISRSLVEEGLSVLHILESGMLETQEEAEERLLRRFNLVSNDMFRSRSQIVAEALRKQADFIAYKEVDDPAVTIKDRQ